MKTTRRPNTIQNAGKAISVHSNGSEMTDSSEKENALFNKTTKLQNKVRIETMSTEFSDVTTMQKTSTYSKEVEMELDLEAVFTLDSTMSVDQESVHSKVVSEYGRDIIDNKKKRETIMIGNLDRHEIKSQHRKQMVIWMEEVLRIFKCPIDTFFSAVHLMDRYLENYRGNLILSELHEIGIVCMFISSKYQEIEPLTLDLIVKKIGHGKISEKTILRREKSILCTLKFKLETPNVLHFIECYSEFFSSSFECDKKGTIRELAIKIAKNGITDRRLSFTVLPSELALCSLTIALKAHQTLTSDLSSKIKNELTSDESIVMQFGKRLRKLASESLY
jgi:hypothetical protein